MTCELTIIQVNDAHGYVDPHPELFWQGDRVEFRIAGGYARIAALFQQIRRGRPGKVLALDCGDTLHGTYAAVKTEIALVSILNVLGLTAHGEFCLLARRTWRGLQGSFRERGWQSEREWSHG